MGNLLSLHAVLVTVSASVHVNSEPIIPVFSVKHSDCRLSWTEQAAGVYHRESRKGRYQLTLKEAKAVCEYEGGKLATYAQLEAARQIGQQSRRPHMELRTRAISTLS